MKKLWWSTNLVLFLSTFLACPGVRNNQEVTKPDITSSTADSMTADTMKMVMDSLAPGQSTGSTDTLSKEEKYARGSGVKREAPDHRTPDDAKLDSIKQEKVKKKKGG